MLSTPLLLVSVSLALSGAGEQVLVSGGDYRPLYMSKDSPMQSVASFYLDKYPVTNQEFWQFTQDHPRWRKERMAALFAEPTYLQHWQERQGSVPFSAPKAPVTHVSWFAADAYCRTQGKRLPSVAEWELAALASETQADGSQEPGYKQKILTWYSTPSQGALADIGLTESNFWGVYDLHGLVWEWTEDFNSSLVTGESRADSAIDTKLFCAAGVTGAVDPGDYAAFMRYGFRSSLEAKYTLPNLGFRCAANAASAPGEEDEKIH
ncbi:formylglycine-generating enzyme family protein [Pseudoalteromonas sp. T1lg88]|uniref:formylglycine-generating enzyme family protein n=1 Tax=Pseudoalteromonas sp. T1lg88 TaxID=2077104 RepID=UPI000CF630C9|nr:formylglycine-generating enzyme family protein [Pseudoalteromonas sp. T1lg88]